MAPGAAPAGAAADEPGTCARLGAAVLWLLLLPFRFVWHAVAIYFLPCLGAYAERLAWNVCCFACLACGMRYQARLRPPVPSVSARA